ncbi:MAG: uncharacterized protein QOJ50_1735 [Cryptosporangiaceae bacterium]|nr:uncharacterized protein [Cryptosporangiaceae bacterium]
MIDAVLGDPLGGVSDEAWDALAGPHFYSSAKWLRHTARLGFGRPGAITVGALAAAVPVSEIASPPAALYRWSDLLADAGLPRIPERGYLLGATQGFQTHLLTSPHTSRFSAATALVQGAAELPAMPGEHACVAMYLDTGDALAIREAGVPAVPVLLDADAWIDIPPGGWDPWLETLPSKRRVAVRREVRRFSEAGYTVTHLPLSECYPALAPLGQATQSKYGSAGPVEVFLGLLKAHVDGMGDDARVAVCARDGEDPVGFCVYYVWRDAVFLRWAGFDYERTAQAAEYFNLVYYAQIMAAAQTGARRLHAGIKAMEAKALRGASVHPLWMVDLAEGSALVRAEADVRAHNRALSSRILDDPRTGPAVARREDWSLFS